MTSARGISSYGALNVQNPSSVAPLETVRSDKSSPAGEPTISDPMGATYVVTRHFTITRAATVLYRVRIAPLTVWYGSRRLL